MNVELGDRGLMGTKQGWKKKVRRLKFSSDKINLDEMFVYFKYAIKICFSYAMGWKI